MESISTNPFMQTTEDEVLLIRKAFDLDKKKIQESLDIILDWFKKQDHLVEALPYIGRHSLERVLLLARGSIEQSKILIDKILTTKGLLPELVFHSFDDFEISLDNVLYTSLPKLNPLDNTRTMLLRLMNENFEHVNVLSTLRFGMFIAEVRSHHEYSFEDRYILDLKNVTTSIVSKINPILLKKSAYLYTETCKIKIKGIHLINAPPFVNLIMNLLKQVLNKKIASRIYIHSTYEDLYQKIPKEILPKDYGGHQPSCQMLVEQWRAYFKTEEAQTIVKNSSKLVSNESKRSAIKFNEDYLGTPGSFKQLNLD